MLGYKPKATNAATAVLEVYQQLPATISASVTIPDYTYAMQIPANTTVTSNLNGSLQFLITDKVNFAFSSSVDPTEVTVYQTAGGVPTYFLVKKYTKALSATIKTTAFSFTNPIPFDSRTITDTNIIGILDITDNTTGTVTGNVVATAGYIQLRTATTAQIADATNAVNTTGKVAGTIVFNTTLGTLKIATGANANSTWVNADGTTAVTPA